MQLVEQHVIKRSDNRYAIIDQAAFASKNLYNAALYEMRQAFIFGKKRIMYPEMHARMKSHPAYRDLPAKVSQQVLRLLDKNWKAWEEALEEWQVHPEKFLGRPGMPGYLDKQKGRFLLIYTTQALSKPALRCGKIVPSCLPILVETRQQDIDQVRIVPRSGYYVVEVVYGRASEQASVDPALMASIDIGVNNLATITSNKVGFVPRIVNGRPLKSTNQFYNKRKAELQSILPKGQDWTARMERMTIKRTRRIEHYLHTASRRIIGLLIDEGIGTLIIGKNAKWKQNAQLRKKDKQHFVQLPHARFIDMLCYKAKLVGIQVVLQEESYTSVASFLDNDPLPTYGQIEQEPVFRGRRVKRGLYKTQNERKLTADVNGSYNIGRKASPDGFCQRSRGWVVHPVRLHV
jgi:putative transposase